ncbi:hypothetical protein RSSM_04474 [Rhodopirellula sallentina SM41]|uniref:Uncharacterized protein n=1 Tax=Rhodopirellula sallentina SM41 TaxID=1263870 RepID=M5TYI8_9BACT|nr:hypothetical protein RSSM_04474 [Rhodopirellula sallentina SM41]
MRHDQERGFEAVAKVAKTFGDSRALQKVLAGFATRKRDFDARLDRLEVCRA